ncbi:MAG: hypothetical protein V5A62_09410 [Haloarculaceae archaeon]
MTDERERERVDTSHLDGVADGCGCAEVWEHLSEGREAAENDSDGDADVDLSGRTDAGDGGEEGMAVVDAGES